MAPSASSALHPIVIPPLQLLPHFTTLGAGLLHSTHPREPVTTLRTLLLGAPPLLANKDKPKTWWRAQCLHHGLPAPDKRTVPELRAALELALLKGELRVPPELLELEHRENGRFRRLNAQVREATAAPGIAKGRGKGKDPLKGVRGGAGVTKKEQPAAKKTAAKKTATKKTAAKKTAAAKEGVTLNLTINMRQQQQSQAAPKPRAKKTAPKPRAKKAPDRGPAAGPKPKRRGGGGGAAAPRAMQHEDDDNDDGGCYGGYEEDRYEEEEEGAAGRYGYGYADEEQYEASEGGHGGGCSGSPWWADPY